MATLVGIAIKRLPFARVLQLKRSLVSPANGLDGDFRGRNTLGKPRQVTLLQEEHWLETCRELGAILPWTKRRVNLFVVGLPALGPRNVGNVLAIGRVRLEVTGETEPCPRMDLARLGLKRALSKGWRGGVTCCVLQGGSIAVGDEVILKPF